MADATLRQYFEVTIEGEKRTVEWSATLASQTQIYDQIVPVGTTQVTVLSKGSDEAGATLTDWTYLLLENRSSAVDIRISLTEADGAEAIWLDLPAGKTLQFWNRNMEAQTAGGAWTAWAPATLVYAQTASGSANLRVLALDDT